MQISETVAAQDGGHAFLGEPRDLCALTRQVAVQRGDLRIPRRFPLELPKRSDRYKNCTDERHDGGVEPVRHHGAFQTTLPSLLKSRIPDDRSAEAPFSTVARDISGLSFLSRSPKLGAPSADRLSLILLF